MLRSLKYDGFWCGSLDTIIQEQGVWHMHSIVDENYEFSSIQLHVALSIVTSEENMFVYIV